MSGIYGLYPSPALAQRAVDNLRSAGIDDRHIAVLSSEPHEEYEFAKRDKRSVMTWIAALGGFIGMATGYLLTSITQKLWAINTGGMPIVTGWTNLIIIFELTMLGAVFACVITLLITARLPGRLPNLYDPEISDGKILIGVIDPHQGKIGEIEDALRKAGITHLKTVL